jgi:hypothetical protein
VVEGVSGVVSELMSEIVQQGNVLALFTPPPTQLQGEALSQRFDRLKRSPPQRQRKCDLHKLVKGGMNGKRVSTK